MNKRGLLGVSLIAAAGLIVYLALTAANLALFPISFANSVWKGYYTLLVSAEMPREKVVGLLSANGLESINEEQTALFFFDFDHREKIPVKDLNKRFDLLDPRFDPFMRQAASFFHTLPKGNATNTLWNVFYLPQRQTPLSLSMDLMKLFNKDKTHWVLLEFSFLLKIVQLVLYLLLVVFLGNIFKTNKIFHIASSIPWLVLVLKGSVFAFSLAGLTFVASSFLFRQFHSAYRFFINYQRWEWKRNELKFRFFLYLMLFVFATMMAFWGSAGSALGLGVLLASLAYLGLIVTAFGMTWIKGRLQEHKLFFPRPIAQEKWSWKNRNIYYYLAFTLFMLFSPFLHLLTGNLEPGKIPAPSTIPGIKRYTLANLKLLRDSHEKSSLPNISDYLTHRAYEQGYPYGRGYELPEPGEKVVLTNYQIKEGRIVPEPRVVVEFNETWMNHVLEQAKQEGIIKLILDQQRPVMLKYRSIAGFYFSPYKWAIQLILCILLGLPLFFSNKHLTPKLLYVTKDILTRRRREAA